MELEVPSSARLKSRIDHLRSLIARDRQIYEEYKAFLYPWYPEEHAVVKSVLMARSRWYNGEILRAKHNLARYIRGEDAKRTLWLWQSVADGVDSEIADLNNALCEFERIDEDTTKPAQQREALKEFARSIIDVSIWSLKQSQKSLERSIYGG